MKKFQYIFPVFFIIFLLFLPETIKANQSYHAEFSWINDTEHTYLCMEISLQENYYTYALEQDKNTKNFFPTTINLITDQQPDTKIPLLYPQGKPKLDTVSKQNVAIYDGIFRIYTIFPTIFHKKLQKSQSPANIELSFLTCSDKHCQPVKIRQNIKNIPTTSLNQWQYQDELTQNPNKIPHYLNVIQEKSPLSSNTTNPNNPLQRLKQKNTSQVPAYDFDVQPFNQDLEVQNTVKALFFGLLAGFILNFMPCVLPVIALKFHSFMGISASNQQSWEQTNQSTQIFSHFKKQIFFFALGILAWFMVLAVLLGLFGFTWGQLFQSHWLMLIMCILVFALALSLFGVFHLPILNLQKHTPISPNNTLKEKSEAFFSGFFATILATPCSGPLLGGVLGYSLTQPFHIIVLIFFFMGLGMALPYLVFAVNPRLARFMPKAGNWLTVMEKVLAFFLVGTALYLFSLLPANLHLTTLVFLFLTSIFLYIWGKTSLRLSGKNKKILALLLFLTTIFCFFMLFILPLQKNTVSYWQEFQKSSFTEQLGKKTLVLKFTADWCPTCKVLENTVFTEKNMQKLADENIQFILVDMTYSEKDKQELLTALDSVSIPLLAVFPENLPYKPIIIRDIYTFSTILKALKTAQE